MLNSALLNSSLIHLDVIAENKDDAIKILANSLISNGYAKKSYLEAVLERERVFPTGLPTKGVGVAIPHTDTIHVINPAIALAVLKDPVKFNEMGNPTNEIDVRLVFMLAIKNPDAQLILLQQLIGLFRGAAFLSKLAKARNKQEVCSLIKDLDSCNEAVKNLA